MTDRLILPEDLDAFEAVNPEAFIDMNSKELPILDNAMLEEFFRAIEDDGGQGEILLDQEERSPMHQEVPSMDQGRPPMYHGGPAMIQMEQPSVQNAPQNMQNGLPVYQNGHAVAENEPAMMPEEGQVVAPVAQNNPVVALNAPNEANAMDIDDGDDEYASMPALSPQVSLPPSSSTSSQLGDSAEDGEDVDIDDQVANELDLSRLTVRTPSPEFVPSAPLPPSPVVNDEVMNVASDNEMNVANDEGMDVDSQPGSNPEVPLINPVNDAIPIIISSDDESVITISDTDDEEKDNSSHIQKDNSNAQMPQVASSSVAIAVVAAERASATKDENQNSDPEPQQGCSRYLYSEPEKKRMKIQSSPPGDRSNYIAPFEIQVSRLPIPLKTDQGKSSKRLNAFSDWTEIRANKKREKRKAALPTPAETVRSKRLQQKDAVNYAEDSSDEE